MSEENFIEIDSEVLEKARKAISIFCWTDDIDDINARFVFFKNKIEADTQGDEVRKINSTDFVGVFRKACNFKHLHYQASYLMPSMLADFLAKVNVSIKDTEYKDFRVDEDEDYHDEIGFALYYMRNALNKYGLELWLLFGEYLAVTKLEDCDSIESWCDEMGLYSIDSGYKESFLEIVSDVDEF